ncbi:MAG: GtrA family protein [Culicoidibacterales bacterium]
MVSKTFNKLLEHQFVRYALIGGINTVISFILFRVVLWVIKDGIVQNIIAFVIAQFVGILVSYILNSLLTFKHKLSIKGFFAFAGPLVGLQLVVGAGGMHILSSLKVNANVSFVILTGVNVVLGFLLTKLSLSIFADKE